MQPCRATSKKRKKGNPAIVLALPISAPHPCQPPSHPHPSSNSEINQRIQISVSHRNVKQGANDKVRDRKTAYLDKTYDKPNARLRNLHRNLYLTPEPPPLSSVSLIRWAGIGVYDHSPLRPYVEMVYPGRFRTIGGSIMSWSWTWIGKDV
jgi:hypothetical protein